MRNTSDSGENSSTWIELLNRGTAGILFIEMSLAVLLNFTSITFIVWSRSFSALNIFVINLAIADLLYAVCIPFYAAQFYQESTSHSLFGCRTFYLVDVLSMLVIVYSIVALALERYFCLSQVKVVANEYKRRRFAPIYLTVVWTGSFAFALPKTLSLELVNLESGMFCSSTFSQNALKIYTAFTWILAFVVPYIAIIYCGLSTIRFLKEWKIKTNSLFKSEARSTCLSELNSTATTRLNSCSSSHGPSGQMRRKLKRLRKSTRLVQAIIVSFLSCWSPLWISQLVMVFYQTDGLALRLVHHLTLVVVYAGGIANPFFYLMLTDHFKRSIRSRFSQ
nr:G protein-coupled receptor [Proales similis]